jgi:thiol-disulfide isomerase/thioredoxin
MSNRPVAKNVNRPATGAGGGRRTPVAIWVALGAIVLVALLLAIVLSSSESSKDLTIGEVDATGTVLPTYDAQAASDPAVGRTAPELTGLTFGNEPIEIANDGVPKVVIFLAHWCGVCQQEVPDLVAWSDGGGDVDGVDVYGVATAIDSTRGNYPPGAWLGTEGWPWPTMVDNADNLAATSYGLAAFPYFVAIDAEGNVVERLTGKVDATGFEALLRAARTGAPASGTGGASTPAAG